MRSRGSAAEMETDMNIAVYCGSAARANRPSFTEGAKALGSLDRPKRTHPFIVPAGLPHGTDGARLRTRFWQAAARSLWRDSRCEADSGYGAIRGLTECHRDKGYGGSARRKLLELADAYVALPGGPGTLDEISEVICLARLWNRKQGRACCLIADGLLSSH